MPLRNATWNLCLQQILHAEKQSAFLFCRHRFKRVHCARASLRQTRLTCSVLSHACIQLIGDQKEACASTSLKQFRLTCLLQCHTQMPKKKCHTNTFTHSPFTHKHFYTQTLLHTNAFTHKPFHAQSLFTHTQSPLPTRMFTHK